jgi:hypothetical protein
MPRVHYAGSFDPARIPKLQQGVLEGKDVISYASAPSSKAAAYHPDGKLFIVTGAATQRVAEEQALSLCNGDPARNGRDGPCYLYSSNNDVVLARRSKTAITLGSPIVVKPVPYVLEHGHFNTTVVPKTVPSAPMPPVSGAAGSGAGGSGQSAFCGCCSAEGYSTCSAFDVHEQRWP